MSASPAAGPSGKRYRQKYRHPDHDRICLVRELPHLREIAKTHRISTWQVRNIIEQAKDRGVHVMTDGRVTDYGGLLSPMREMLAREFALNGIHTLDLAKQFEEVSCPVPGRLQVDDLFVAARHHARKHERAFSAQRIFGSVLFREICDVVTRTDQIHRRRGL